MFRSRLREICLAAVTALLLGLTGAGNTAFWPVAWAALLPLLVALQQVRPGRAFGLGLLAGTAYYILLLRWVLIVLGLYGNLDWWIAVPALLLLALYMGAWTGLFAAGVGWLNQRRGLLWLWLAPPLWVGLDYLRGTFILGGFPWHDLAYSQFRQPFLVQIADLAGHHGLTFLIVLANCLIYAGVRLLRGPETNRRGLLLYLVIGLFLVGGALVYNQQRLARITRTIGESPACTVGVIQGNIDQDRKWSRRMQGKTVEVYTSLSRRLFDRGTEVPSLLVWPETALPFYLHKTGNLEKILRQAVGGADTWLLTGAPSYDAELDAQGEEQVRYYNSAFLVSPAGRITGRYDKQHLVPFGEYVPWRRYLPLPAPLVENVGDFTPGGRVPPFTVGPVRIGVLICFESIFPELSRNWVDDGADLLINITNDAWFGRSGAPWQHLSMAVFRAVENRRSLVRAANTGISCFIDPAGRLHALSPLFEAYGRAESVSLPAERSLYARGGYLFGPLCLVVTALLFLYAVFRR